jgi:hypothetical protein
MEERAGADKYTESVLSGGKKRGPWVGILKDFHKMSMDAAARFGMSASDRSNVRAVEKPTVEDEKKKFFEGAS